MLADFSKQSTLNGAGYLLESGRLIYAGQLDRVRRKVAILGFVEEQLALAPMADPDWEVWGLNGMWRVARDPMGYFRADRWFEMHPMSVQTKDEAENMRRCPVPIYTMEHEPTVPNAIKYPLDGILAMPGARDYFACTMAYQVALAVYLGFQEIGLYGIDLALGSPRERLIENPSLAWWLGYAAGRGITVTIPEQSTTAMLPHRYGYDYWEELNWCEGTVGAFIDVAIQRYSENIEKMKKRKVQGVVSLSYLQAEREQQTEVGGIE